MRCYRRYTSVCVVAFFLLFVSVQFSFTQSAPAQSVGSDSGPTLTSITPPVPPGAYAEEIIIGVNPQHNYGYRFLRSDGTPHTEFFIPLETPLILDAPPSIRVSYHLQFRVDDVRTNALTYTVDRSSPESPLPRVTPGTYDGPIEIREIAGHDSGIPTAESQEVFYLLQSSRSDGTTGERAFRPISDRHIEIPGTPGQLVEYQLLIYTEDGVGNRSAITRMPIRIDRRREIAPPNDVLMSPQDGAFANEQLLLVDDRFVSDVVVTLNRPEGNEEFAYTGEQIISGSGTFRVTITAKRRVDGADVTESVTWSQGTESLSGIESGRRFQRLSVFPRFSEGTPLYNLQDQPVTGENDALIQPLILRPGVDSESIVTLRTRLLTETESPEWRYTFILDGRQPPPVEAVRFGRRVILFALAETEIQYRLTDQQGNSLGAAPSYYSDPLDIDALPAGATGIEARTRYPRGVWSSWKTQSVDLTRPPRLAEGSLRVRPFGETIEITASPENQGDSRSVETGSSERSFGSVELRDIASEVADSGSGSVVFSGRLNRRIAWTIPLGYRVSATIRGYSGAVSAPSIEETVEIELDTAPPPPPEIVIRNRRVTFRSDFPVMARIGSEPFQPVDGTGFHLTGQDDRITEQRIEAYAIDGDRLSPRATRFATLDDREPVVPPLYSQDAFIGPYVGSPTDESSVVTNQRSRQFVFLSQSDDLEVYYEIAAGQIPPLPTAGSQKADQPIVVSYPEEGIATDAGFVDVYLRGRARFQGSSQWSDDRVYRIRFDTTPPAPPTVVSPQETKIQAITRVSVVFNEPEEEDVTIWYRTQPDRPFQPYRGTITIDPRKDSGNIRIVEAYTEDRGGNRSYLADPITVRYDRNEESSPQFTLNGLPTGAARSVVTRDTLVGLTPPGGHGDHTLEWRVYELDTPEKPSFENYQDERLIRVPTERTERTVYVAEARATEVGTGETVSARLQIVAGGVEPLLEPPEIIRYSDGRSGSLFFPGTGDRTVFVSTVGNETEFREIRDTIDWFIPDEDPHITIRYFVVDGDGRRSPTDEITIERPEVIEPPVFAEISDGGVYRTPQTLQFSPTNGTIRYNITSDGSEPAPVHQLSAPFETPINLEPAIGEDRVYTIRAATFLNDGRSSNETRLSFRIDRRPPSTPILTGAEDGQFFPESVSVSVRSGDNQPEDVIFLRVVSVDGDSSQSSPFQRHTDGPIELIAEPGTIQSYRIEAYTVDSAGNRSQSVANWTIHVDQEVVYVRPGETGSGDGTRERPFADINTALEHLRRVERKTLFLSSGLYRIQPSLFNEVAQAIPDLSIVGGFEPESWRPRGGATTLGTTRPGTIRVSGTQRLQRLTFDTSFAEIEVTGGTVSFSDLSLTTLETVSPYPTLLISRGTVEIRNATFGDIILAPFASSSPRIHAERVHARSIDASAGDIDLANGTIGYLRIGRDVVAELRESTIGYSQPLQNTPLNRMGEVISVEGGVLSLHSTEIYRIDTQKIAPVVGATRGAELTIQSSYIYGSEESDTALLLLRGVDSSVHVSKSFLSGSNGLYVYGVSLRRSNLSLLDSVISLSGGVEQAGYTIGDSDLSLARTALINRRDTQTSVRGIQSSGSETGGTIRLTDSLFVLDDLRPTVEGEPSFGRTSALDRQRVRTETVAAIRLSQGDLIEMRGVGYIGWERFSHERDFTDPWPAMATGESIGAVQIDRNGVHPLLLGNTDQPMDRGSIEAMEGALFSTIRYVESAGTAE